MKQLEPRSKTIGGNTFYIRPFPAFVAANMSGELSSLVAPMIGGLAPLFAATQQQEPKGSKQEPKDSKEESSKGLFDINVEDAAPAIAGAFSSISGDKVERLLKKLLTVHGNIAVELDYRGEAQKLTEDLANEIFCGDTQDMFILAFEVIRINFNGFFKKLGVLSGSASALLTKMPPR